MRFRLEVPRSALEAMQGRYPASFDAMSGWWFDLAAACDDLCAWWEPSGFWEGQLCVLEGSHEDRHPVACRLVSELLEAAA